MLIKRNQTMLQALIHRIQLVKKDSVALKVEIDKLDFTKLIKVQASLNILKTNPDDLDFGKLKTVPVYLKKMN